MKRIFSLSILCTILCMMISCSSKKQITEDNYYSNPSSNVDTRPVQPKLKKREVREVDKLAAAEKENMRAVGMGNDYDEKYARRDAIRDGQATLASYIETAVVSLTSEYRKRNTVATKKLSETEIQEVVETAVSQKVSVRMVGVPEIYDASDGTVQVYVCVELSKTTDNVLGEVYDQLTKDEVLGIGYDRMQFIKENKERLQELRNKVDGDEK